MSIVVQKYGGSSVADAKRINLIADRVSASRRAGADVVVVVSAMGTTTDRLLSLAREVSDNPPPREMDMLLTAGERVTMALLAMALDKRGIPAVSYTGSQAGILTDASHGEARIKEITGERVRASLDEGRVVIVAGFQGVDPERKEITTLGRGGSDTTAVALAAALGCEACEINTDVAGVFTADPRVVPDALKLDRIGYHEMLAMAEAGAGVLMPYSVDFAHRFGVPVHVRSSFGPSDGTWVVGDARMRPIVGIAQSPGRVSIIGPEAASRADLARKALQDTGIDVLLEDHADLRLTLGVPKDRTDEAVRILHGLLITQAQYDDPSNE